MSNRAIQRRNEPPRPAARTSGRGPPPPPAERMNARAPPSSTPPTNISVDQAITLLSWRVCSLESSLTALQHQLTEFAAASASASSSSSSSVGEVQEWEGPAGLSAADQLRMELLDQQLEEVKAQWALYRGQSVRDLDTTRQQVALLRRELADTQPVLTTLHTMLRNHGKQLIDHDQQLFQMNVSLAPVDLLEPMPASEDLGSCLSAESDPSVPSVASVADPVAPAASVADPASACMDESCSLSE
jgi:prefoldin subunit 5